MWFARLAKRILRTCSSALDKTSNIAVRNVVGHVVPHLDVQKHDLVGRSRYLEGLGRPTTCLCGIAMSMLPKCRVVIVERRSKLRKRWQHAMVIVVKPAVILCFVASATSLALIQTISSMHTSYTLTWRRGLATSIARRRRPQSYEIGSSDFDVSQEVYNICVIHRMLSDARFTFIQSTQYMWFTDCWVMYSLTFNQECMLSPSQQKVSINQIFHNASV